MAESETSSFITIIIIICQLGPRFNCDSMLCIHYTPYLRTGGPEKYLTAIFT